MLVFHSQLRLYVNLYVLLVNIVQCKQSVAHTNS